MNSSPASREVFLNLPQKKRPVLRKVVSVGPETKNAQPSAIKFKNNWWRPLFVVALAAWAQVYNENQAPINSNYSSRETSHHRILNPEELPKYQDEPLTLYSNSFTLDELRHEIKIIRLRELEQKADSQVKLDPPKMTTEKNIRIHALSVGSESSTDYVNRWLTAADWPQELIPEAREVIYCESRNNPNAASPNGLYRGLFGLARMWFIYAGEDPGKWADPIINAKVAHETYLYDINKGQAPWTQWDPACRPKSF